MPNNIFHSYYKIFPKDILKFTENENGFVNAFVRRNYKDGVISVSKPRN